MPRTRSRWILFGLLVALLGVGVWVYWPKPQVVVPQPADLASLDERLVQQIEIGSENVRFAPDAAATWGELGMVYQANGMPDLAIACYEHAVQLQQDEPRWWYFMAMAKKEFGKTQETLELLERVQSLKGDFAPAYWRRGLILLDFNELPAAEQAFRQSIDVDPRDDAGWRGLARTLLQQDRPEEAIEVLKRWLGTGVNDLYSHQLLGQAYRQTGQIELAEAEFREAGDVKPAWQDAWMYEVVQYGSNPGVLMKEARHCITQGQAAKAISILQPLAERYPDDISVLNTLANAYLYVQEHDSAVRLARESIRVQPQHFEAHLILATALLQKGNNVEAMAAVERALECNPAAGDAYEIKGLLLEAGGKRDDAIAVLRRAEQCEPNDPRYQYQMAMVYCRAKEWEKGIEVFNPIVEKYPSFVPGLVGLALACIELRQFDRASELLAQARQRDPRDPSLQYAERRMAQLKAEKATAR